MAKPLKKAETPAPAAAAKPAALLPLGDKPRKAFSLERVEGGWRLVTFTYASDANGDRLVDVQRGQPDLKAITIEYLKIAQFKYWTEGVQ